MKLIFITREDNQMPAARVRCYGFASYLKKQGIQTEVFSYADNLGAGSGKNEVLMRFRDKLRYNVEAFQYLYKKDAIFVLQRFNYHSFAPWILKLFRGQKLIFDLDDWEAREEIKYYFGNISSSKAEMAMRMIAKHSSLCIGASRFLVDFLLKATQKVAYIPTGVDTDIFMPQAAQRDRENVVLSWMGTMHRLDNVENLEFLIGCFNEISKNSDNVRLEILGDGVYRQKICELIEAANNKKVMFKKWITPNLIPEYLQTVDIGVMPLIQDSKFNKAKSPTRIFEYMAMEKPVLASCIGEAGHIIRDGENGCLAETRQEFISKLKGLIKEKGLRLNLGKNARRTIVDNYSLEVLSGKLLTSIKSL
ncbi:MAG: glycosyltransferase [Candidatus Omnitrophica bacterium]|nr:glycosyltransferase [Candidatus Omnitrophota bacterium]